MHTHARKIVHMHLNHIPPRHNLMISNLHKLQLGTTWVVGSLVGITLMVMMGWVMILMQSSVVSFR